MMHDSAGTAAPSFFTEIQNPHFNPRTVAEIKLEGKILIMSDFHMGYGRRDDLAPNREILTSILENYYFKNGWTLILNGDIEELAKYSYKKIRTEWADMYRIFDLFAAEGRLYKTLGNHDDDLIFEKNYPYKLYEAIRIDTGFIPAFIYHGHQASRVYTDYNNLIRLSLRYFFRPFGIRNISSARSPYRRFHVEKFAYKYSMEHDCISIIGHTHRALFESLGRFDFIKYEIMNRCRDYPGASEPEQEHIAGEVSHLRQELGKLKRSERRDVLRQSLYGDEMPVPCLFNSGCAIGKKGINAIELDSENISLVYWFIEGHGMKFISRGWYDVEKIENTPFCRSVLNQDRLDYVNALIKLLG
ncbi:MAG: serine/threonine protein phosphatase [Treponema sp.]|nr:serine/threonine protein phosphatase [Treponema sp.]